ncbi:peptidyl-prolyl cis-trans isomerase SurA [Natronocella acetinitrilica]|uniref:Chaperone SurA n=1 Tax=Natronocella acetinitrilica TaxID=414046 RepID=A0AAE3KA24_9GAMM|nr:peptidylprolyl isomerase [Natronocella acetinitrilica]MCP1672979.1 peptidyl-prolyl cis-trans isomerase SurA [Natronocella acetinitrilica]
MIGDKIRQLGICALAASSMTLATLAGASQSLDRIVGIVNDDIILASELEAEIQSVRQQFQGSNVRLPSGAELERQVMDRLILKRLQLAYAQRVGITVDEETLNAAVRQVAAQNNMNLPQFQQALQRQGMSFAAFREDLREDILLSRLHQREVERQVEITQQEIEEFLSSEAASQDLQYRVSHILISTPEAASPEQLDTARQRAEEIVAELRDGADFAETAARVSDGQRALEGGDLGWRAGGELPSVFQDDVLGLQPGDIAGPIRSGSGFHIVLLRDVRSEDAQLVQQTRARHILIRTSEVVTDEDARLRLESLLDRIENGEDFSALARVHSDDSGTASRGGDLDWVSPGQLVPAFERVMDNLGEGEISQPFETQFGWHVVKVEDRRERDSTEDYRRMQAAQQIRERKSDEVVEGWLRRLRDEAYVENRLAE